MRVHVLHDDAVRSGHNAGRRDALKNPMGFVHKKGPTKRLMVQKCQTTTWDLKNLVNKLWDTLPTSTWDDLPCFFLRQWGGTYHLETLRIHEWLHHLSR